MSTAPSLFGHPEQPVLLVDRGYLASGAVEDADAVVVVEAENLVSDGEASPAEDNFGTSRTSNTRTSRNAIAALDR